MKLEIGFDDLSPSQQDAVRKAYPILAHFEKFDCNSHANVHAIELQSLGWRVAASHFAVHQRGEAEVAAGLRKLLEAYDCLERVS